MAWLGLLKLLLSLASSLAGYMRERQLLDAGAAEAVAAGTTEALRRIEVANMARAAVRDTPEDIAADLDNRDRKP